ncbi:SDR family NAD(P)-dependent oxidoreductase [Longispora albida]|uniref:SDR family NAD(P)-dependent oxidoreductase n=1 Tax=Longispora albida TaxID=203523 RepID=UPI00037A4C40|nr:SDR family oxidoreductase [Longispora albida]
MPTALVTGATAGIGAEFARQLAAGRYDLVLVARDAARLEAFAADLRGQYTVDVEVLPADLASEQGLTVVADRVAQGVDLLVNNAGIGLNTAFTKVDYAEEQRLLRLNVEAVLRLTHAALPVMVERGSGDVINVSSVAGFGVLAPGSTYSASKAWVTNFSQSIALSVRKRGVRVMALCPGFTHTEFHDRAGISKKGQPGWLWLSAVDVVRDGLRDLRRGKLVSIPSVKYKFSVLLLRHLPSTLMYRLAGDTRGKGRQAGT